MYASSSKRSSLSKERSARRKNSHLAALLDNDEDDDLLVITAASSKGRVIRKEQKVASHAINPVDSSSSGGTKKKKQKSGNNKRRSAELPQRYYWEPLAVSSQDQPGATRHLQKKRARKHQFDDAPKKKAKKKPLALIIFDDTDDELSSDEKSKLVGTKQKRSTHRQPKPSTAKVSPQNEKLTEKTTAKRSVTRKIKSVKGTDNSQPPKEHLSSAAATEAAAPIHVSTSAFTATRATAVAINHNVPSVNKQELDDFQMLQERLARTHIGGSCQENRLFPPDSQFGDALEEVLEDEKNELIDKIGRDAAESVDTATSQAAPGEKMPNNPAVAVTRKPSLWELFVGRKQQPAPQQQQQQQQKMQGVVPERTEEKEVVTDTVVDEGTIQRNEAPKSVNRQNDGTRNQQDTGNGGCGEQPTLLEVPPGTDKQLDSSISSKISTSSDPLPGAAKKSSLLRIFSRLPLASVTAQYFLPSASATLQPERKDSSTTEKDERGESAVEEATSSNALPREEQDNLVDLSQDDDDDDDVKIAASDETSLDKKNSPVHVGTHGNKEIVELFDSSGEESDDELDRLEQFSSEDKSSDDDDFDILKDDASSPSKTDRAGRMSQSPSKTGQQDRPRDVSRSPGVRDVNKKARALLPSNSTHGEVTGSRVARKVSLSPTARGIRSSVEELTVTIDSAVVTESSDSSSEVTAGSSDSSVSNDTDEFTYKESTHVGFCERICKNSDMEAYASEFERKMENSASRKPFPLQTFRNLWKAVELDTEKIENSPAFRAANNSVSSNDSSEQGAAQYGRILPGALDKLFREIMGVEEKNTFVDLGHGIGNACLQASYTIGCHSKGVELVDARFYASEAFRRCLAKVVVMDNDKNPQWRHASGMVELKHGRLEDPAFREWLISADRVFVNNYNDVFGSKAKCKDEGVTIDARIAALFASMKPGSVLATMHEIGPLTKRSQQEVKEIRDKHGLDSSSSNNASFFTMKKYELGPANDTVSWSKDGGNTKKIEVYKYTRLSQPGSEDGTGVFLCTNPDCEHARTANPIPAAAIGDNGLLLKFCDCKFTPIATRGRRGRKPSRYDSFDCT